MVKKPSKMIILLACFLTSCSINYNESEDGSVKSEEIPDSIMENFKLVQIKDNKIHTEITSSLAEIYESQNKTLLFNVNFKEYSSSGDTINTAGNVDEIVYFNDNENANLKGNLKFESKKENIKITGNSLYWNKDDKIISSDINDSIKIIKDDGSKIEGYGFTANLKYSTFSFKKDVKGESK
ncbi:MAG: LPS export ABC transporter periplasmic protein LptC [Spirochaetales bacterium]|nr:LPS export ABC transporter periplasmic protein LptC [Spirochaetales bacterium]